MFLNNQTNLGSYLYIKSINIHTMIKLGLLATLEAKPGKEAELEAFLKSALPLAQNEPDTKTWYAFKINANTFGIFDTFEYEQGRQAHLSGPIASALMAKADELLAQPPLIQNIDILASK
jgi:quinol monooxygenase YgiN